MARAMNTGAVRLFFLAVTAAVGANPDASVGDSDSNTIAKPTDQDADRKLSLDEYTATGGMPFKPSDKVKARRRVKEIRQEAKKDNARISHDRSGSTKKKNRSKRNTEKVKRILNSGEAALKNRFQSTIATNFVQNSASDSTMVVRNGLNNNSWNTGWDASWGWQDPWYDPWGGSTGRHEGSKSSKVVKDSSWGGDDWYVDSWVVDPWKGDDWLGWSGKSSKTSINWSDPWKGDDYYFNDWDNGWSKDKDWGSWGKGEDWGSWGKGEDWGKGWSKDKDWDKGWSNDKDWDIGWVNGKDWGSWGKGNDWGKEWGKGKDWDKGWGKNKDWDKGGGWGGGWNDWWTAAPTLSPTLTPTFYPTFYPTISPTLTPTLSPTWTPTLSPTLSPTITDPTFSPTYSPTFYPTIYPTFSPTHLPTATPTISPTIFPTFSPTVSPTLCTPEDQRDCCLSGSRALCLRLGCDFDLCECTPPLLKACCETGLSGTQQGQCISNLGCDITKCKQVGKV